MVYRLGEGPRGGGKGKGRFNTGHGRWKIWASTLESSWRKRQIVRKSPR